ncbi:hypothetical protein MRX96_057622 [Rhipicephalus microplus]
MDDRDSWKACNLGLYRSPETTWSWHGRLLPQALFDVCRRPRAETPCVPVPLLLKRRWTCPHHGSVPTPQDSSDDEADTRRKLAQGNPQGESNSSADSSDSRLSYDSQHTEDSIDSSASSTTTGVASVFQVDPSTVATGPPGVPAIDAPEETDEALHHETVSPHPAAAFLKDATKCSGFPHPLLGASASRPQPRGHPPTPLTAFRRAAAPTTETVDHEGFQTVRSKAALRRTRNLTSAALPVDPAVKGTVLYRPASAGGSFRNCPRLTIAQALSLHPGVAAIRVNQHRNVVAVDVSSQECLVKLLALTELKGIPVTARQPADRRTSMGFLHGVDGDAADENLLSGLQSAVRVLSASREGRTVTLRFEGPVPPRPRDTVPRAETSGYHHGLFDHSPLQTSSRGSCEGRDKGGSVLCQCSEGPRGISQTNPSTTQPPPANPCSCNQHSS